jgi:hypothetical protein
VARFTTTLPLTGRTFTEAKLMSDRRGPHSVALDPAGNAVDPQALRAGEGGAKIALQGRLRDDVYALSIASTSELVPVSIWADFSDEHLQTRLASADVLASHEALVLSKLQTVTSKITAWLDKRGFPTYERGLSLPVITADVPAVALTELGRLDGVAFVEVRHPRKPAGTGTNCSTMSTNCSPWFDTVKLAGAQAIVPSASNQRWCNGEGWVPSSSLLPAVAIFDNTVGVSGHTTWVSEILSATASAESAPGAAIYSAATGLSSDADKAYQAWNWCMSTQGVDNMNNSFSNNDDLAGHGLGAYDMAFDWYVWRSPYPFIVGVASDCEDPSGYLVNCSSGGPTDSSCSAGSPTNDGYVGSRSYNGLIVGAANDTVTPLAMACFSPFKNPATAHGDFELPNLVAPGEAVASASAVPYPGYPDTIGWGTSASAPIVTGTALLMKQLDPNLVYWPEMMRAALLTASTRTVDGPRTTQLTAGGSDIKQGAGLLNAATAVSLADSSFVTQPNTVPLPVGRNDLWYDFTADFTADVSLPYNILTERSGRLRVVIAWDASVGFCDQLHMDGSGCTSDVLDADLDLWVSKWTGSGWQRVCMSYTYDSSWELCDVSVNANEQYKAEIIKNATVATGTYVGIAWNNYDPNSE